MSKHLSLIVANNIDQACRMAEDRNIDRKDYFWCMPEHIPLLIKGLDYRAVYIHEDVKKNEREYARIKKEIDSCWHESMSYYFDAIDPVMRIIEHECNKLEVQSDIMHQIKNAVSEQLYNILQELKYK